MNQLVPLVRSPILLWMWFWLTLVNLVGSASTTCVVTHTTVDVVLANPGEFEWIGQYHLCGHSYYHGYTVVLADPGEFEWISQYHL